MKAKPIELHSRYPDEVSSLEPTEESLIYELKTTSTMIRCGFEPDSKNITFIDLSGGPFMAVGNTTLLEGHKLKQIIEDKELFKFIFEKNEDKE